MKNEFDFEPEIRGGIWQVVLVALIFIGAVAFIAFMLTPARALTVRPMAIEPVPWQIVDRDVCVKPLAVWIVVREIFAKAGMSGAVTVQTRPLSQGLPVREFTRKGAQFQFQTRWRVNQCLHSFRSLYEERGE